MRALAALALFAIGCGDAGVRPCRAQRALVRFQLANVSAADRLDVQVTVEGRAPKSFPALMPKGATGEQTLEIAFDGGYPAGKRLTVSVTAKQGDNLLGSGSDGTTLDRECAMLRVTIDAVQPPDMARLPMVTTVAGSTQGFHDGASGETQFSSPGSVSVSADGTAYVADSGNHRIRKIAADGTTSTLTGGAAGDAEGTLGVALFRSPTEALVDGAGKIFVADAGNQRVKRIDGDMVTTLVGNGMIGNVNGTGGAGGTTSFHAPAGLAIDAAGFVYVADATNNLIRKVSADGSTTVTLAGSGAAGFVDGMGAAAQFNHPTDVATDGAGNVYVADRDNSSIRKVAPDGTTTTLAGNGMPGFADGAGGKLGVAQFNQPEAVAADASGNVYVADMNNHRIRRIGPDGTTSTYAGSGNQGFLDAPANTAMFSKPTGLFVDGAGVVWVADTGNQRIRKITPP